MHYVFKVLEKKRECVYCIYIHIYKHVFMHVYLIFKKALFSFFIHQFHYIWYHKHNILLFALFSTKMRIERKKKYGKLLLFNL